MKPIISEAVVPFKQQFRLTYFRLLRVCCSPNYRRNIATLHSLRNVASTLSQQYVLRMFQITVIKLLGLYDIMRQAVMGDL
uniref:Uncharacterized protein n=1 Tax=Rhipicephalus zambeziensis TaxID=60191 RepID=A0A224Z1J4_9ACAR